MSSTAASSTAGRSCHERICSGCGGGRGARLARHALPPSGLAQGRRVRLPRAGARRLAGRLWRGAGAAAGPMRRTGRRPAARNGFSPRRGDIFWRSRSDELATGDLLLFRWRPHLPAKHAGILIEHDRFVHAYEGMRCRFRHWCRNGGGASPASFSLSCTESELIRGSSHGNHSPAGRRRGSRRPVRSGRRAIGAAAGALAGYAIDQALINGTRRIEGPGSPARGLHGRGGRGDPARLRHGAGRRHADLGDAFRGEAHDAAAGRQGAGRASPNTTISPTSPSRSARARSPASGASGPTGARLDRTRIELRVHRGTEEQAADPLIRGQAGRGQYAGLSRHGLCRCSSASRSPTTATASRSSSSRCCGRSASWRRRSAPSR